MSLSYGSICSGVEAATLAWAQLGFRAAWFAEIEPFPCAVLAQRWPHVPNHGDMTRLADKILTGAIPAPDILVGGTPCFSAGHLVLTETGYRPIEDIKPGDQVVTHQGRLKPVVRIGSKTAAVGTLKAVGQPQGIVCTPEHPFYGQTRTKTAVSPPEWIAAREMPGKQWVSLTDFRLPVPEKLHSRYDCATVMALAGFYLGDGWLRRWRGKNKKAVIFGLNEAKYRLFKNLFADIPHHTVRERTTVKVGICNTELADWLCAQFGEKAAGKRIPAWCLNHPHRRHLWDGYVSTDGTATGAHFTANSVSSALAYGMAALAQTLGFAASVAKVRTAPTTVIEGRTVNQQDYYCMRAFWLGQARKCRTDGNRLLRTVQNFRACGEATVYNIEVADDHSYIVNNAVVHNCQAFSVAGLRGSLDDTRGNLTLELIRILDATDLVRARNGHPPCLLVWENVPGVLNTRDNAFGCFLGGLAGEDCPLVPSGQRWTDAGSVLGHQRRIAWRVLDAQYFGVPQRRRRVFVVASAGAHDPAEILFERNGVCGHLGAGGKTEQSPAAYVESGFGSYREMPVAGTVRAAGGAVSGGSESLIVAPPADTCTQTNVVAIGGQHPHAAVCNNIAPTLTNAMGAGGGHTPCVALTATVRKLTPLECERLQGMPDNHTRIVWRGKPAQECPDTPRYKAIGNSMAVPVMRWIGQRIQQTQPPTT